MILSIRGLGKQRPQEGHAAYVLRVPCLEIATGDKVLITGPSGSGKSTILDLLGMSLKPDNAERFLFFSPSGRKRSSSSGAFPYPDRLEPFDCAAAWSNGDTEELALSRRRVGYVLQTGGLLPFLTVRENIELPQSLVGRKDVHFMVQLCRELKISSLMEKLPGQLSVGERQRAAIARALASHPELVLADEPTAALDPANSRAVMDLFMHMVDSLQATLILVTHDPAQAVNRGFRHFHLRQHASPAGIQAVLTETLAEGPQ